MRQKTVCFAIISLILLLAGCYHASNQPDGLWFYTFSRSTSMENDTVLTPANFICLQHDGTYTRDFGSFDYGQWRIQDKKIVLTNYKYEKTPSL